MVYLVKTKLDGTIDTDKPTIHDFNLSTRECIENAVISLRSERAVEARLWRALANIVDRLEKLENVRS